MRAAILLIALAALACNSPEAEREIGGGAGGDIGNRNETVNMHQGAEAYHDTPCRMTNVECPKQPSSPAATRENEN